MGTLHIVGLVLISVASLSDCLTPPIDQQYDVSEAESTEHDLFDLQAEGSEIKYDIRRLFKPRRPIKDDSMANIIKNRIKEKSLEEDAERLSPDVLRNRRRLLKMRQQQRFRPKVDNPEDHEESPDLKKKRISEILSGIVMDRYDVDDLPSDDLITEHLDDEVAVIPPAVSSEIEGAKAAIDGDVESEGGNELLDRFVTTYLESTTTTEAPETYTFPSFPKLDSFSTTTTTTSTTTTTTTTATSTATVTTTTKPMTTETTTATTTTTESTTTPTTSTTPTTTAPSTTAAPTQFTTSYTTAPTHIHITDEKDLMSDEDIENSSDYYYKEYYEDEVTVPVIPENNTILVEESIPDHVEVVYPEGSASTEEPPKVKDIPEAEDIEEIPIKYIAPKLPGLDFNDPAVFLTDRQEWEPEHKVVEANSGENVNDDIVIESDDLQDGFVSLEKSLEELEQGDLEIGEPLKQVPKFKRKAWHYATPPPPLDPSYFGSDETVEVIDLVGSASEKQSKDDKNWITRSRLPKAASKFPPEQVGTSIVVGPSPSQDSAPPRRWSKSDLDDEIIKSIEEVLDVKIPVDSKLLYRSASNRFVREGKTYQYEDEQNSIDGPKEPYAFSYTILDEHTGLTHSREEEGDENGVVTGSYEVLEPNCQLRRVRYRADHIHGFDILGVDRRPCDESQKQTMLHAQKEAAVKQHLKPKKSTKKNKRKKRPTIKTKRRRNQHANKSKTKSKSDSVSSPSSSLGSKIHSATTPRPVVVATATPIPVSYSHQKQEGLHRNKKVTSFSINHQGHFQYDHSLPGQTPVHAIHDHPPSGGYATLTQHFNHGTVNEPSLQGGFQPINGPPQSEFVYREEILPPSSPQETYSHPPPPPNPPLPPPPLKVHHSPPPPTNYESPAFASPVTVAPSQIDMGTLVGFPVPPNKAPRNRDHHYQSPPVHHPSYSPPPPPPVPQHPNYNPPPPQPQTPASQPIYVSSPLPPKPPVQPTYGQPPRSPSTPHNDNSRPRSRPSYKPIEQGGYDPFEYQEKRQKKKNKNNKAKEISNKFETLREDNSDNFVNFDEELESANDEPSYDVVQQGDTAVAGSFVQPVILHQRPPRPRQPKLEEELLSRLPPQNRKKKQISASTILTKKKRNMLMNIILRPGGGDKTRALPKPRVDVRSEDSNVIIIRLTFPKNENIQGLRAFAPAKHFAAEEEDNFIDEDPLLPSASEGVAQVVRRPPLRPAVKAAGAATDEEYVDEHLSPSAAPIFEPPSNLEMFKLDEVMDKEPEATTFRPSRNPRRPPTPPGKYPLPPHPPLQLQPHLFNRPAGVPPPPRAPIKPTLIDPRPPRQQQQQQQKPHRPLPPRQQQQQAPKFGDRLRARRRPNKKGRSRAVRRL